MVSVVIDNVAAGVTRDDILQAYPALHPADIDAALAYSAGNYRLKFKVDENLPAECALIFREAGFEAPTVLRFPRGLTQGLHSDRISPTFAPEMLHPYIFPAPIYPDPAIP